ncbi:MAG: hypothetical protein JNJ54_31465 [Myxococcaceae bacterium]|nr:hypothetical protein [Myxococcaceae bacterium]
MPTENGEAALEGALALAWSPDEARVALGFPKGLVTIHSVNPETGGPADELGRLDFIEADICLLAFREDGKLVAVGANTCWAVADGLTGEVVKASDGELLTDAVDRAARGTTASLSPDGEFLFVGAKSAGRTTLFRVELATRTLFSAGHLEDAGAAHEPRVWAIDATSAWVEMDRDGGDGERRRQGLLRVDFRRGTVTPHLFEKRLWEEHLLRGKPWPLELDVKRGLGVRPRFDAITPVEQRGRTLWPAFLEIFSLDTLETVETIGVAALPDDGLADENAEGLREPPSSEEHLEGVEALLGQLSAARFDPVRKAVWVSMKYGRLKRVGLGDEENSELIVHQVAEGVTNVAALSRRLGSHVLAISPRGRFLGFGFPNDFRATPAE